MPAPIRPYVLTVVAMGFVLIAALLLAHAGVSGGRSAPASARLIAGMLSVVYLLVMMGAAWLGYGSGILACLLNTFVVEQIMPRRAGTPAFDGIRFALFLAIALLISWLGETRRRREAQLLSASEDLEERVRQRTKEAEESAAAARDVAESLREQAQLLDFAHDAILSLEQNGGIRFWNRGAEQMYGFSASEVLGANVHGLLKTVFPEPLENLQSKLMAGGRWEGELTHTRKDGSQLRVASRWALRRGADGKPRGILEINTDITDRRRIEDQLRHTQKLESLGVLAGGVAHDFNNLLTGILGNSSLALDSIGPHHPNRVLIEEVMRAAERAADLTRQLLAYAGKGRFVMRTIDLSDLVREISGLVQASFPKQAQLRLQLAEGLPGMDADPGQMQQIVMNLVINGAEAIGAQGGSVLVRTSVQDVDEQYIQTMSSAGELLAPGRYIALEVHDTGCGMDEETLSRIFDPFFTTKFAGRGLGLSAVLGIVRAHKGALKVYSRPGNGTTFKVLFPVSANPLKRPEPAMAALNLAGSGTVLVVDDEDIVRATARHTLERFGYQAVLAEDGARALELYRSRSRQVSLVLLDLTMPVMSGEETLRQLQMLDPNVKVLLTSGYNEIEAVQRFAGKGLAGFIQKPYTAAALAEKVKEVLTAVRT